MFKYVFVTAAMLFLASCGGGSEDQIPETPKPILVTAGVAQTIDEQQTLDIVGVASGGTGEYVYAWLSSGDVNISHADTTAADASLVAPVVTAPTDFIIRLVATDSAGKQGENQFVLTVNPVNLPPEANIQVMQLEGYGNNRFPVMGTVVLDGSNSRDLDAPENMAEIATYEWQQTAGTLVTEGLDLTQSSLSFVAPITDNEESISFSLTVTDQEGESAESIVSVVLVGQSNTLPTIELNSDIAVFSGERIALQALVLSDAPRAKPFSIAWQSSMTTEGRLADIDQVNQIHTFASAPLVNETQHIIFTATARDSFGNEVTANKTITVWSQLNATINDTGVSAYGTDEKVFSSYQADFAGQDADYGNDRISTSGFIDKTGRGDQGFDFTRLNENGDQVDNTALPWRCVRDNITGLVWETKVSQDISNLHHADHVFTWYQSENNGNFEGDVNEMSTTCANPNGQCNTEAFVDAVNEQGLCGFFDWRLPTHQELQSIIHYGKSIFPLIDSEYFPFSGDSGSQALWYWTNVSSADGVNDDTAMNAWAFDFKSGVDNFLSKSVHARVRLVRAGKVEPEE
ncbi:Lcl C-terminal domain-containing protein [Agaribacter flavus]|uniref:DUF1566 domain-containing protein n=1 Tax=Agaribacter flavus TaxID=1902781 RepID=A0ABV7FRZ8_9ALTE